MFDNSLKKRLCLVRVNVPLGPSLMVTSTKPFGSVGANKQPMTTRSGDTLVCVDILWCRLSTPIVSRCVKYFQVGLLFLLMTQSVGPIFFGFASRLLHNMRHSYVMPRVLSDVHLSGDHYVCSHVYLCNGCL